MKTPISNQAIKYMRLGLSVAPSDGGWLASYKNSAGVTQEIGIWADETKALRAGVLWCQGFRFDVIRAEYESGQTLRIIACEYDCSTTIIRECVIFGGGIIRKSAPNPANRLGKKGPSTKGRKLNLSEAERARRAGHARAMSAAKLLRNCHDGE